MAHRKSFALVCIVLTAALTACSTDTNNIGGVTDATSITTHQTTTNSVAEPQNTLTENPAQIAVTLSQMSDYFGKTPFAGAHNYTYTDGASVPQYSVSARLVNILNLNQFVPGTDEVGDYYFAQILLETEKDYIVKNGFVVGGGSFNQYYGLYENNRYSYVPSFITTDSAVHSFHLMYDYVLKTVEQRKLITVLSSLTQNMLNESYRQYKALVGTPFENAALRNTAFFGVAAKLLKISVDVPREAAILVNQELELIDIASGISVSPLINYGQKYESFTGEYMNDYSQYIPRGHYSQSEALMRYFKATMWYGQMTFRSAREDEVRSALLMTAALQYEQNISDWSTIFDTINFFVGECDDITAIDFTSKVKELYGGDFDILSGVSNEVEFAKIYAAIKALPPPAINSVPVYNESLQPDRDSAITGFRFLGQRFTVDASIFQRLMDRETSGRMFPNSLDVPAAFGSDEALAIIKSIEDLSYPSYEPNLKKVRQYMSGIDEKIWMSNLYWSWLNMLRPLAENRSTAGLPFFMQNSAWTRKELNTFQGSWTELKHDTILYSKQPMAEKGGGGDEPPPPPDDRGYVEPNPTLFGRLAALCRQTISGLSEAELINADAKSALENLQEIAENLRTISELELRNMPISDAQYDFIREYGSQLEHIWSTAKADEVRIFGGDADRFQYYHPDAVVADVATDPNGSVLEEATGYGKTIIVAFPRDGKVVLGRGLVYSQYEFIVPISERMTDETWHEILRGGSYDSNGSFTPDERMPEIADWKYAFIAK